MNAAERLIRVPTIDLMKADAGAEAREGCLRALREAVHGVGAFYLSGHGVDERATDAILLHSRQLFSLPERDLDAIEMARSPHFRGYTAVGNERTGGRPDWREQLDVGLETVPHGPKRSAASYWVLHGPNQWPAALPTLREAVLDYMERLQSVAARLLAAIAESLALRRDYFVDAFAGDPHVHLKIIRYPGRDARPGDGVGAHKDYGFLTLLLQDTVGGLQVSDGAGNFIDVPPVPGTFVVNLGEMLEIATAGYLTAMLHRVVRPPAGADRLSVPFFYNPRLDFVSTPIAVPAQPHSDHVQRVEDTRDILFTEYGRNAIKGWCRSHPRVAERYYPDLRNDARDR